MPFFPYVRYTVDEFGNVKYETFKDQDDKDINFPHKCPKCRGPAYIGFLQIDCKRKCNK